MLYNRYVVEFLLRKDHDTYTLIEDTQFVYNLMKLAKVVMLYCHIVVMLYCQGGQPEDDRGLHLRVACPGRHGGQAVGHLPGDGRDGEGAGGRPARDRRLLRGMDSTSTVGESSAVDIVLAFR